MSLRRLRDFVTPDKRFIQETSKVTFMTKGHRLYQPLYIFHDSDSMTRRPYQIMVRGPYRSEVMPLKGHLNDIALPEEIPTFKN